MAEQADRACKRALAAERLAEDRRLANEAVRAELEQARAEIEPDREAWESVLYLRDCQWASRRRWQGRAAHTESERDALKARLDAVRVLHRQVPIYPYVDDCSEDHGHDDGHNMVESDDGEWLCTASVPLYFVCDECWDDDCCRTNWPCATVRVLDGLPAYLPPRTVVDVHLPEPGEAVSTDG